MCGCRAHAGNRLVDTTVAISVVGPLLGNVLGLLGADLGSTPEGGPS
jgi:hypothetical protein